MCFIEVKFGRNEYPPCSFQLCHVNKFDIGFCHGGACDDLESAWDTASPDCDVDTVGRDIWFNRQAAARRSQDCIWQKVLIQSQQAHLVHLVEGEL